MADNSLEGQVLLYSVDGHNYCPISASFCDISIDDTDETDETRSFGFLLEPISTTIILPHKNISRKKFKKWLMSKGFNRDLAEWFCKAVKSFHGERSYQYLYYNGLFSSTSQGLFNILFDTLFPITNNKETEK